MSVKVRKEIVVSACLCGNKCRYNGQSVESDLYVEKNEVLILCPEILGGLGVPREPCEIVNGNAKDVINGKAKIIGVSGNDYTKEYLNGVENAIKIVKQHNIKVAYLKQNSPSCGFGKVYDGQFQNKKIIGNGIFAEELKELGIKIIAIT